MTKTKRNGPVCKFGADSDTIEWTDYPRILPGEYRAYCKWGKRYLDPGFRRWTCLLRWEVLTLDLLRVIARVPQWFPLGNGDKPHASRRGIYLPEWIRANGGPPARKDRLSPRIFVRRFAHVEVGDTEGPAPYSVVRRIIEWETGSPGHSVNKSHSQGGPRSSAVETESFGDSMSDFEASARAGVEGETTPTDTHRAGVPAAGSPVKGPPSEEISIKTQRIQYPPWPVEQARPGHGISESQTQRLA